MKRLRSAVGSTFASLAALISASLVGISAFNLAIVSSIACCSLVASSSDLDAASYLVCAISRIFPRLAIRFSDASTTFCAAALSDSAFDFAA